VNVPAGGTATAPFTVSCPTPPTTGTLKVTTSTSGSVPTSNYTVTVDGNTASAQQIAPNNGSVTFSNLSATGHSVALSGFPANCTLVSGTNPRTVTVTAGTTTSTTFSVSCTATTTTGTLTIATSTTGQNQPTSYTLRATTPSGTSQTLTFRATDSQTFSGIPTGSYQVQLTPSTVAANCTVTNANPQTVNVPAGGTTVTFTVSCTTGTITIKNLTTGSNLDPDGYAVIVTASDGTQEPA